MTFSPALHQRFLEQARWTEQAQRLLIQSTSITSKSRILEVGCGTGALLTSMFEFCSSNYVGLDIQFDLVNFAQNSASQFSLTCGDGYSLPFTDQSFDGVICHFLLLWVASPVKILTEMRRVTQSGGFVAALAEPDYGSQIEYPEEFERVGTIQRESLIKQGANPDLGRRLSSLLVESGFENISSGILGSFQSVANDYDIEKMKLEQAILASDLKNEIDDATIQMLIEKDTNVRKIGTRVHFIPTFFGWGFKP
jgi:SAM-dependent methyltransferase